MKSRRFFRTLVVFTLALSWVLAGLAPQPAVRAASAPVEPQGGVIHVPGDVANLQDAIHQVTDGGVIELAAGSYYSPNNGFVISNLGKGFTVRAASGAYVVLDGGGVHEILRFQNSSRSSGGPVLFQDLVFANGLSDQEGVAGGVTIYEGEGTFSDVTFENNLANVNTTVGGAVYIAEHSKVIFNNILWKENISRVGGAGIGVRSESDVYIHRSKFVNNITNPPNHDPTASGGGINLADSTLRVSNTIFENNEAGGFGGAIYAIGTWADPVTIPRADVIVSNSTFTNNKAYRHPSVIFNLPTEGGAINAENQTSMKIYNSRFISNEAMIGGGVNLYRSKVEIYDSVLQGNRATDSASFSGFGGAISVNSADGLDDGMNNRPASELIVEDTLLQGRFDTSTTVAQTGGCLFAGGDGARMDGNPSIPDIGTVAENRAKVSLRRVTFLDCDVISTPPFSGVGGGLAVALVDLLFEDAIVGISDAIGANGSGGGMAVMFNSLVNTQGVSFAQNSADQFGGGVFSQGSELNLGQSYLIENIVQSLSYGSAIFTGPDDGRNLPATGIVQGNTISNNPALGVFDDDRDLGPINDTRYNDNLFFHPVDNAPVYSNSLPGYGGKTVAELNNLVIVRGNGTSTPKSQVPNTDLGLKPPVGMIIASPSHVLHHDMLDNPPGLFPAHLSYAWSGNTATLNGQPLSEGNAGGQFTTNVGTHTLIVDGQSSSTNVPEAEKPSAIFTSNSDDSSVTLSWNVESGTFLDAVIDQGVTITPVPVGSVQISTTPGNVYNFYSITEEGGIFATVDSSEPLLFAPSSVIAIVGLNMPTHYGHIPIQNIGGSVLVWSAQNNDPDLFQLVNSSGQTSDFDALTFSVIVAGRPPGVYTGSIEIDAGEAGSQTVLVTVHIVDILRQQFLSLIHN
jgi:hypothetical protein